MRISGLLITFCIEYHGRSRRVVPALRCGDCTIRATLRRLHDPRYAAAIARSALRCGDCTIGATLRRLHDRRYAAAIVGRALPAGSCSMP